MVFTLMMFRIESWPVLEASFEEHPHFNILAYNGNQLFGLDHEEPAKADQKQCSREAHYDHCVGVTPDLLFFRHNSVGFRSSLVRFSGKRLGQK
jgi:hypothetical protein